MFPIALRGLINICGKLYQYQFTNEVDLVFDQKDAWLLAEPSIVQNLPIDRIEEKKEFDKS